MFSLGPHPHPDIHDQQVIYRNGIDIGYVLANGRVSLTEHISEAERASLADYLNETLETVTVSMSSMMSVPPPPLDDPDDYDTQIWLPGDP